MPLPKYFRTDTQWKVWLTNEQHLTYEVQADEASFGVLFPQALVRNTAATLELQKRQCQGLR
jgi:hypothetical protein